MDAKSKNVHLMGDRSGFVEADLRTILASGFYFEGLYYGGADSGQVSPADLSTEFVTCCLCIAGSLGNDAHSIIQRG